MDQTNQQPQPAEDKGRKLQAFQASPELAIFDMLDQINTKLEVAMQALNGLDLSKVESLKGETPEKGKDYFTEEELEQIKEIIKSEILPVKGIDYFDGETPDKAEIVQEVLAQLKQQSTQTQQ